MALTDKGITYPTSSDNIAPLETHFANLATTADNVGIVSGAQAFNGSATAGSTVTVTLTFAAGLFDTAPKVIAAVSGSPSASAYVANVYGTTTATSCVVKVYNLNATTSEALTLNWFASTYA